MKNAIGLLLALTLVFALTACSGGEAQPIDTVITTPSAGNSGDGSGTAVDGTQNTDSASSVVYVEYDSDDLDSSSSSSGMSSIALEGDAITLDGGGATIDGTIITITSAGMYSISGTLNDGQIVVDTEDEETVKLVLNGADIACSTSAPIYIVDAEKVVITLAEGTDNYVKDGASYTFEDSESDEPNAAIFSKCDLTINGSGSLTVDANYNNGIQSKDDLKITGGSITVYAVNDGIKGRDSIAVRDGDITVNAGGDGMQSNNDEDSTKGYVAIEGGTFDITAGADGIQAETTLIISGGDITISSGGGSANSSSGDDWGNWGTGNNLNSDSSASAKGLKSGITITITGGTIDIDSSDDSIHSNDSITISDGTISLASGDDGIHSDSNLEIDGGDISITKSYEGIESAVITINDGTIHITASDDGINVVGGNDGSAVNGRPGQNSFASSGNNWLYINGGYIAVDAAGDGLDVNGSITMTRGVVIISGPTNNNNGALDYLGAFKITGGLLVAAGSSGMAEAPSASSTQYSVILTFQSAQAAGTIVHIEAEDGGEVLTFEPAKAYQSLVLCSPELENGATYTVYTGGSSTGTVTDGVYSGGTYTAGTQITSFTISSVVTSAGAYGGGVIGGGGGNMRPGGMGR